MERTNWFNHEGHLFRIKADSYYKIEELGKKAGKYLTYTNTGGIDDTYELTDNRNVFNADKTWKFECNYDEEFDYNPGGPVSIYDCLAWSMGYIYTKEQFMKFLTMNIRKR